jgi:hypothetical protein
MTCPEGGTFFICNDVVPGGFIGCCNTTNACTPQGCGDGGLYGPSVLKSRVLTLIQSVPTGFNNTALNGRVEDGLHDQQCNTARTFYSCELTNPTFWGCCNSNPCGDGICPSDDLMPAYLSSNPADWSFFTDHNASATTTTGLSTAGSSSHIPTASGGALTGGLTAKSKPNVGAIAGGAIGGAIVLIALVIGLWWFLKRKYSRQAEARGPGPAYPEARYSGVPTLVPSNHPGSPTKSKYPHAPVLC